MENLLSSKFNRKFRVVGGALRILLGAVLFLVFVLFAVVVTIGTLISLAGSDGGPGLTEPGGVAVTIIALVCLGFGVWFLYSGLILIRMGRGTADGQTAPDWWPESGFGPLDTGLIMLGICLFAVIAVVASILDPSVPLLPNEHLAQFLLWTVAVLVGAIGLIWYGLKSARTPGSSTGRFEPNMRTPERLLILSVCSYFLYTAYWVYRNWEDIKWAYASDINPYWRTVGLFIPVLNVVLVYKQFRDIYRLAESMAIKPRYSLTLVSVCCLFPVLISDLFTWWSIVSMNLARTPGWAYELSAFFLRLVSLLPMLSVQETINRTWQAGFPRPSEDKSLSASEAIWVLVGGLLLISLVGGYLGAF